MPEPNALSQHQGNENGFDFGFIRTHPNIIAGVADRSHLEVMKIALVFSFAMYRGLIGYIPTSMDAKMKSPLRRHDLMNPFGENVFLRNLDFGRLSLAENALTASP